MRAPVRILLRQIQGYTLSTVSFKTAGFSFGFREDYYWRKRSDRPLKSLPLRRMQPDFTVRIWRTFSKRPSLRMTFEYEGSVITRGGTALTCKEAL